MAKIRVYYKAMNRGAQGIVNAWLVMHPKATLDDLRKAFPNRVNPSMPPKLKELFRDPETAKQLREEVGFGYIDKTNDIMKLQDGSQIVLVSMWSADSFEIIKEHAAQYGIEVAEGYDKAKDTEGKGWYHEYLNGYVPPKPRPVFEIRADMQVKDVWAQFHAAFDTRYELRVYVNPSTKGRMADGREYLRDLNCTVKPGVIEVSDITIGNFEILVRDTFGIGVQVAKSRGDTAPSELVSNKAMLKANSTLEAVPKPQPKPQPKKKKKRGCFSKLLIALVIIAVIVIAVWFVSQQA